MSPKSITANGYLARPGQSLPRHLSGTAKLAHEFASCIGCGNIAHACGILHDLGKFSPAFKKYIKYISAGKTPRRGDVHHAWQGALFAMERLNANPKDVALSDLLANVIASHHGGLTDMIVDSERFIPNRIHGQSTHRDNERLDCAALHAAEPLLCQIDWQAVESEFRDLLARTPNQPFRRHMAVKFLYSCLVDADRCDAAGFVPDSSLPDWNAIERCLNVRLSKFEQQPSKSQLDASRAAISSQCAAQAVRVPGVFTLSVPTGGGKTLSSLRFAIRHARANGLKRIVYVIPYLSIIDQTARDFRDIFAEHADSWLLEHHSNFILDSEDEDDANRYDLGTQRWDAPIVLTTMVQFLESIASNRAADLRKFHNMTESVFVFDEVQALPIHCIHLFNETINFLSGVGKSSIVLCTATQPHLDKVERPVRLSNSPSLVSLDDSQNALFKRTNLVNRTREDFKERTFTCADIAAFAQRQVSEGLSTLVILNTKKEAESVFAAIDKAQSTVLFYLSTNLCPAHRINVLDSIRSILKEREEHPESNIQPVICISTQLVEAGVDISFDCVIRAEAGLDSIVQAAGRCNRHGKSPLPRDVFVVRVADDEENLANLPDIQNGKDITDKILNLEPTGDLDSDLDNYYSYRFQQTAEKMDCPVWIPPNKRNSNPINPDGTVMDWLGLNRVARGNYKHAHDGSTYPGFATAFQTVAEHFSVIEGRHIGVVVPYEGADAGETVQNLISQFLDTRKRLNTTHARDEVAAIFRERSRILRQLQQFSVSVFASRETAIAQIATKIDDTFYLLSPDYYDKVMGLTNIPIFLGC